MFMFPASSRPVMQSISNNFNDQLAMDSLQDPSDSMNTIISEP